MYGHLTRLASGSSADCLQIGYRRIFYVASPLLVSGMSLSVLARAKHWETGH